MAERRSSSSDEDRAAYDLKELFIEACARDWRPEYFMEGVSRSSLEAMSILDSRSLEDLEAGAPLYSGPDLFTSLIHEVSSETREKWLHEEVTTALQNPILRTKVSLFFDKELEASGILNLMGGGKRMADKVSIHIIFPDVGCTDTSTLQARALVNYRFKRSISSIQEPGQSMEAGDQKAFMITLKTLIGGHGGLLQESNLYFNYRTPFQVFTIVLRDATKLSTIPPIDLDEKTSARRELRSDAGSDTTSQTSSIHYGRHGQQRSSDKENERGSESSSGAHSPVYRPISRGSPNPPPRPRSSSARGYTIADGPWLYQFKCDGQSGKDTTYVEIKDEQSYKKMVNNFQEVIGKDPSNKYRMLLIHVRPPRSRLLLDDVLILLVYGQNGLAEMEGKGT